MFLSMLAAYAPWIIMHVAMIVFAAIGGRRHRLTAFWLLLASGCLGVGSSVFQVLQVSLISDYGGSRSPMLIAFGSGIGMIAGVFEIVGIALLALRRPTEQATAWPANAPAGGQITR